MLGASLIVGKTPKGKYKAYFWGSADGHISDWRGCNYRYAPLDWQPIRGFDTQDEAKAFALAAFSTEEEVIKAGNRKPGRHLSDHNPLASEMLSLYTADVAERIGKIKDRQQNAPK